MKIRCVGYSVLLMLIGIAVGYAIREGIQRQKENRSSYVIRREGAFRHINPLLECDIAEDVLRNRELVPFKNKIVDYVNSRLAQHSAYDVSVYFRELNNGMWFSVGDMDKFIPASLRKVPLMIALLKMADQQKGKLLDVLITNDLGGDYNAAQNIRPSQVMVPGHKYTVRDLIYRMIVYSDNNAFTLLTKVVDSAELDRVYALLRMQNPRSVTDDSFLSVQTYASFFRILYNATYLSREMSEWALATLAKSEFRAGLVAGVPPDVPVAHKFGEKSDEAGSFQLHDCGIVYHPKNPYVLCVMSKGPNLELLDDAIVDVSRLVFNEVIQQQRQ